MKSVLKVHISHPPATLDRMKNLFVDGIHITTEDPPPEDTEILVSGRPDPEFIALAKNLRAVIIPWAGVPESTRELMLQHPAISVHNLHHNAPQVAEMAVALVLAAAKRIVPMDRELRKGDWSGRYEEVPSVLLRGKTALVLGYGSIGRYIGEALKGLGMKVLGVRRSSHKGADPFSDEIHPTGSLSSLLPRANVFVITLPLTNETRGLIGAEALALLPANAILVNVGRGPIVDEDALSAGLKNGHIGSAGLDVWWNYPANKESRKSTYPSNHPLYELDNVVLSPHRAGAVEEVDEQRMAALVELLNTAALGGEIPNKVHLNAGY